MGKTQLTSLPSQYPVPAQLISTPTGRQAHKFIQLLEYAIPPALLLKSPCVMVLARGKGRSQEAPNGLQLGPLDF